MDVRLSAVERHQLIMEVLNFDLDCEEKTKLVKLITDYNITTATLDLYQGITCDYEV